MGQTLDRLQNPATEHCRTHIIYLEMLDTQQGQAASRLEVLNIPECLHRTTRSSSAMLYQVRFLLLLHQG